MMTEEERFRITSNEFVDLIVEYNQNPRILERYKNAVYHIMNSQFAIVYLPGAQLTGRFISQYGSFVIPAAYGLMSQISLEASGITRLRRIPIFNLRGEGVLIGIIDTGIDYTNPVFIKEDGTTKIAAIWDQTIESDRYPGKYLFGTQYLAEDINEALNSTNPLEIVPSTDEHGHGTMLAGIAAGSEIQESGFAGVVPDAELIVVKLKQMKPLLREFYMIPPEVVAYQENDIMWAVTYMVEAARELGRPIAICIGLGSSQGSHDGSGGLGMLLSIQGNFPGVVITVAAGNEGNTRRHFHGIVDRNIGYSTVELVVGDDELGFTMELWGKAPNTYSLDILSPAGEYIPRIVEGLSVNREISFVFERTIIFVDYELVEAQTGDQVILMRFNNPTPGVWRFQVYSRGDLEGEFNIWLPVDGFISNNTYFTQSDPYVTITSPGTSRIPITTTSYNPVSDTLYQAASRGFSRSGEVKPDLAAPGVNIQAPTLSHEFTEISGTGAATAHMAGLAAIVLEWGIVNNNYPGIDTVEVKKFLIRGAERSTSLSYPNRDWGYGIVDVFNVFDILRVVG